MTSETPDCKNEESSISFSTENKERKHDDHANLKADFTNDNCYKYITSKCILSVYQLNETFNYINS